MAIRRRKKPSLVLPLSSMGDIAFLLIIFFMLASNFMKTGNAEGKMVQDFFGRIETPFKLINNKVIVPDNEEQERNPRSRSAKLRIAEKK